MLSDVLVGCQRCRLLLGLREADYGISSLNHGCCNIGIFCNNALGMEAAMLVDMVQRVIYVINNLSKTQVGREICEKQQSTSLCYAGDWLTAPTSTRHVQFPYSVARFDAASELAI